MVSIFTAAASLSALSHIAYSSKLEPFRRFAFGVLLFSVVCTPLFSLFDGHDGDFKEAFPEIPSVEESEGEEVFEKSFREGIKRTVCEKFSLNYKDVRILCENFSRESYTAEKIRVVLSGAAATADYREIEKYLNGMEIGECKVEIEIG